MKPFIYLLSIISIIALLWLFIFKQPNGQAWLSVDNFLPNTQVIDEKINYITNKFHKVFDSDTPDIDSTSKVYRWKDSDGNWSYSDKPKALVNSEEVIFDQKNIVVLPTLDIPSVGLSNASSKDKYETLSSNTMISMPSKVIDLYNNAKNVQKLMDVRQQEISKAMSNNGGSGD